MDSEQTDTRKKMIDNKINENTTRKRLEISRELKKLTTPVEAQLLGLHDRLSEGKVNETSL